MKMVLKYLLPKSGISFIIVNRIQKQIDDYQKSSTRFMKKYSYTLLKSFQIELTRRSKIIFIVLCFAVLVFMISSQKFDQEISNDTILDLFFANQFRTRSNRKGDENDLKHILFWTSKISSPFNTFGTGQIALFRSKCEFTNCYVTADRRYFRGDITKFDVVAFNGRDMRYIQPSQLPQKRSPYQKYIFVNLESSSYQPVCSPWWDDFFNWTLTYKLNSDVISSYIYIRDKNGVYIGPRIDMDWVKDMKVIDDTLKQKLKSKNKAAAWFASHCITKSKREEYVESLQTALEPYGLTVDIYGKCGSLRCPRGKRCFHKVASDYYFYLSFENAFAEDYVTEKLLTALQNDAVPIVFGAANYTRFVPPGSYIDAHQHKPTALAAIMADNISNPTKYHDFFRWQNYYSYAEYDDIKHLCNICTALNNKSIVEVESTYPHFRSWWNPEWEERCQEEKWET